MLSGVDKSVDLQYSLSLSFCGGGHRFIKRP